MSYKSGEEIAALAISESTDGVVSDLSERMLRLEIARRPQTLDWL
jgi:hypothetical protein